MEDIKDLIKRELVVKKDEVTAEEVRLLKNFLRITEDGNVILRVDRSMLTATDLILLYLAGKRLAHVAGLSDKPTATLDELVRFLSLPKGTIAPRLKESMERGEILREERGEYLIISGGIEGIIARLSRKLKPQGGEFTEPKTEG